MKTFSFSLLSLVAGLAFLPAVNASYEPNVVSADAQWVINVDLDTLRASSLGQQLLDCAAKVQVEQSGPGGIRLDWVKTLATIDSITAYGTKFSQDPQMMDGTLVVRGNSDLRKIVEGFVTQGTLSSPEQLKQIEGLPFEAYRFGGSGGVIVALPHEPVILVSKSKDQLIKALEIIRGHAPSLKTTPDSRLHSLLGEQRDAFLDAASIIPSSEAFPAGAPQARILRMAQSGGLTVGEKNHQAIAHLQLIAADDAGADKLAKILQGFAAMASLAQTDNKQLTQFLQSINVQRDNDRVILDLSYPSDGLIEMTQNLLKRHEKNPSVADVKPTQPGLVIADWNANQDLDGENPTAEKLVDRTVEHVMLKQGSTVVISCRADRAQPARLDVIEITTDGGGPSLKFEAEYMTLHGFQRESFAEASGRKVIMSHSPSASARFQFPGEDGSYTIKVRYVGQKDAPAHFAVRVLAPEVASETAE